MTGDIEGRLITRYRVDELAQAAANPAERVRSFPALGGAYRMLNHLVLVPWP